MADDYSIGGRFFLGGEKVLTGAHDGAVLTEAGWNGLALYGGGWQAYSGGRVE
ncbi:hypothetical protein GCM10009304_03670 [Pseudomonas matsuisoli]|uniref:Uncharacterized protein n=1 Tax=Pseudomonas matsuisoli TaxID=1515666 RepID=A0A917PJF0_9PSED|nr:hypothetical protein GCM10009304_03670 [Pseudomonas matsuisoli]